MVPGPLGGLVSPRPQCGISPSEQSHGCPLFSPIQNTEGLGCDGLVERYECVGVGTVFGVWEVLPWEGGCAGCFPHMALWTMSVRDAS